MQSISAGAADSKNYVIHKSPIQNMDGVYSSKYGPMSAAKKAATQVFKKMKIDGTKTIQLEIRQTNTQKIFSYTVQSIKLKEPLVIERGNKNKKVTVTYRFETKIVSNKAPKAPKAPKARKSPSKKSKKC
jgi:hypothetical protein